MIELFQSLLDEWRHEADVLRRHGCPQQAELLQNAMRQVEGLLTAQSNAPVPLAEAVRLSGYSASQFRRWLKDGTVRNVGTRGAPAVMRGDLPRKPGYHPLTAGEATKAVRQLRAS